MDIIIGLVCFFFALAITGAILEWIWKAVKGIFSAISELFTASKAVNEPVKPIQAERKLKEKVDYVAKSVKKAHPAQALSTTNENDHTTRIESISLVKTSAIQDIIQTLQSAHEPDRANEVSAKKIFYMGVPEGLVFYDESKSLHKITNVTFFEFIQHNEDEAEYYPIADVYTIGRLSGNLAYTIAAGLSIKNPQSLSKGEIKIIANGLVCRDCETSNWTIMKKAEVAFE